MRCAEYHFYLLCVFAVLGRMKNHFNQLDLCSILLSHCLLITFLSALWIFMCVYIYSSALPIPLTPCNFIYYRVYWLSWMGRTWTIFIILNIQKRERERKQATQFTEKIHGRCRRIHAENVLFMDVEKTFFEWSDGTIGSFRWFSWVHALFQSDMKNHVLYPVHYTMLPFTIAWFRRIEVICDKIIITQWLCRAAYGKLVELDGSELMMMFAVHRRWAALCWSIKSVHKHLGTNSTY